MIGLPLRPAAPDDGLTLAELYEQARTASDWHRRAACRPSNLPPGWDSTWFVPPIEPEHRNAHSWNPKGAAAVRMCQACPVRSECRQAGQGQIGVWGGELQARNPWATSQRSSAEDRAFFRRYLKKTGAVA